MTITPTPECPTDEAHDGLFDEMMEDQARAIRAACEAHRELPEREMVLRRAEMVAQAFGEDPYTGQPYYQTSDVLDWIAHSVALGGGIPRLGPGTIQRVLSGDWLPSAPFRARYEYLAETLEGFQAADVARLAGFHKRNGQGDTSVLKRRLGLIPQKHNGTVSVSTFVTRECAVKLAKALEMDLREVAAT